MRRLAIVLVLALLSAAPAVAQSDLGPKAGTWGGETSFGSSGSLLRFRSPTSAWLIGLSTSLAVITSSGSATPDEHTFNANARFGIRYYGDATQRARPLMTLSALVAYQDFGSTVLGLGGAAEVGGVYFFSPHLSLGVAGNLNVQQIRQRFGSRDKILLVQFSGFQVLGAVYF